MVELFDATVSFEAFCRRFESEEACIQALYASRWPDGFRCPRCEHDSAYVISGRKLPLYECRSCRYQVSLIAGTVFERTRTPLRLWFQAIYLHANPPGISALRLAEIIGVTYKTAWTISHKLRHAMTAANVDEQLQGRVRVNCDFYGYPFNHTRSRHPMEHPILAGCSVDDHDQIAHIALQQLPPHHLDQHTHNANRAGASAFVDRRVDSRDVVVTHGRRHLQRFRPLVALCGHMRNWINGVFHGIGAKHLQAYLEQFAYRWNRTASAVSAHGELLHRCARMRTILYRELIARPVFRLRIEPFMLSLIPKKRRHRFLAG